MRNLVVCDEAHAIFKKPHEIDVKSDENIRLGAINRTVRPYLVEFRARGIGAIISDQRPSMLMPSVRDQTAIKCLFRVGSECARIYSPSAEVQEFVMQQERYRGVVMDGCRGSCIKLKLFIFCFYLTLGLRLVQVLLL